MRNVVKVLKNIADNASLNKIDDWAEITLYDNTFFVHNITWKIFSTLTKNRGTHLSLYEFQEAVGQSDDESQRLFSIINTTSRNMSYEEFHSFCVLGTINNIEELLFCVGIHETFKEPEPEPESGPLTPETEPETEDELDYIPDQEIVGEVKESGINTFLRKLWIFFKNL